MIRVMRVDMERILEAMHVIQTRHNKSWPREMAIKMERSECVSEVLGCEIDRTQ